MSYKIYNLTNVVICLVKNKAYCKKYTKSSFGMIYEN